MSDLSRQEHDSKPNVRDMNNSHLGSPTPVIYLAVSFIEGSM